MRISEKFLLASLVLYVCIGSCFAVSSSFYLDGPNIYQNACSESQQITGCAGVAYASQSLILQKRLVLVPTGKVIFRFHLSSHGPGPTSSTSYIADLEPKGLGAGSSFSYKIVVTAAGPNKANGQPLSVTGSAAKVLHGISSAELEVPINIEWAESVVTFQFILDQEICPQRQVNQKLHEIKPDCWNPGSTFVGPDLSSVNLGLSLSFAFPKDAFLVLVTPAAAFQIPVVPVAIVYAPLGNGGKAQSLLTITQIVASNQGFADTSGKTSQYSADDKTGYTTGLTVGICYPACGSGSIAKANAAFKFSGTWDNASEVQHSETEGKSGSVVTSDQWGFTYTVGPSKAPLDQLTWETQPFWRDLILAVINAQYALWDYPTGPVIQPLASADIVELVVQQLHNCRQTPSDTAPTSLKPGDNHNFTWQSQHAYAIGAMLLSEDGNHELVATKAGTSGSSIPTWNTASGSTTIDGMVEWTEESDHFIPYAGDVNSAETQYIWLTSKDCSDILSIDKFYLNGTQSSHPLTYRLVSGGASLQGSTATTYSNTQQTTQTQGQSDTVQTALKVTSAAVNSQDATFGVDLLGIFGINYTQPTSSSVTTVYTTMGASTLQSQTTLTGGSVASTTIQDSYSGNIPVNVMQDSTFLGLAVQDTNMHYASPFARISPTSVIHTNSASQTGSLTQELQSLPVVPAGLSRAVLRRARAPEPSIYLRRTNYGYIVIRKPTLEEFNALRQSLEAIYSEGIKRHVVRTVPEQRTPTPRR